MMRKIKCIISLIGVFLMFFTSCTNEELLPYGPDVPVLNQGRVVFSVNTGKSMVCTRASKDDENAIRSLGVFIVKPDGNLAEGVTRFYEAKDLIDKKLAVSIPVDIMGTPGVKAYLVANGPDKAQCDQVKTEKELLDLAAATKPDDIGSKGIPMASGTISLNFTGGIATVDVNMKRVMSTLCAKVVKSKGVTVGPSDFTFKVHGVSCKEGYYFKDACKDAGVDQEWSSTSTTLDEEASLGYFYQSKAFKVEVVSKSTGQSRTIEIPLEKAQMRNKKYVLKIHPKPISEGKGEFTVTVEAWDAIETDVDFEQLALKKDLPADKFEIHDNEMWLLTNNHHETDFGSPKDWFVLKEGSEIVSVQLEGLIDEEERGVVLKKESGIVCATSRLTQADLLGKIVVTVKDKKGVISIASYTTRIPSRYLGWNDTYIWGSVCKVVDGVFVYTGLDTAGKGETFSCESGWAIEYDSKRFSVADVGVFESLGETPENGLLYDKNGTKVAIADAAFGLKMIGDHFSVSLKCKKKEPYYGYVKFKLKRATDGLLVTQVLKIKFDFATK
ncbi:hypothetical protein BFGS084_01025 [Bacteroides fragilis]|nr:hypothetical protein BFGS084_01025 [Bacteroides fragilis]